MGSKERKERERKEMQELILNTANAIMKEEGLDQISIRKIANRIEYSPAIIYHYFKDKDEIISQLMQRGYHQIVTALSAALDPTDAPEQRLKQMTRNYIEVALQMPDEYKTVLLNSSPEVVQHSASLFAGAAAKKPALKALFQCLQDIYQGTDVDDAFIELTAQVIAASTFGLLLRLIIEKDLISPEQTTKLIDHFIHVTLAGLLYQRR